MASDDRFFNLHPEIAKVEFNKSIAGCYRDGNVEYDAVGVLLLTWKEDDLDCKEKEVNALERVFRDDFKFHTEQYEIPPTESQQSLLNRLSAFLSCYDDPFKLGIIYYGGHAQISESADGSDLNLFARISPPGTDLKRVLTSLSDVGDVDSPVSAQSTWDSALSKLPVPQQPRISFSDMCNKVKAFESDILWIVDCCFAAGAFRDQEYAGRRCELICSIAEKDMARAPNLDGSFTKALIDSLVHLLRAHKEGFTTTQLFNRIYGQQHLMHKPHMFDHSRRDYGRIWLRPCQLQQESSTQAKSGGHAGDSKHMIDVRFHLTKSLDLAQLNRIAKALRWIPFVRMITMQEMHSPQDDLSKFIKNVRIANRLRPLLARIRRRRERKQAQQLLRTDTSSPSSPAVNTTSEQFLNMEPRDIELFDWSTARAVTSRHQRLSPDEYFDSMAHSHANQPAAAGAGRYALSEQAHDEAAVDSTPSGLLPTTGMGLSQHTVNGLFFFALGILAPSMIDWAAQSCASAFVAL